jgi:acyl-CoA dehydrogenase
MSQCENHREIREAVRALCSQFPDEYHRKIDEQRGYPDAFVNALTKAGWLAALIPLEYGGSGLSLAEASVIMEEINRSGGNSAACHGQMYVMSAIVRSGSAVQKQKYLPRVATGELRIQSMGVTEPTTGSDTTQLKTAAVKRDGRWIINGQKVWISRVQHSDLMILLARTTPISEVQKKSDGLSCFLIDLRLAIGNGLTVRPIPNMVNHETNELFFDNLEIPAENLLGEEGNGFRTILDGLNAERTLIAAECIGDGRWFVDRAAKYAERASCIRPKDRAEPRRSVSDRRSLHRGRSRRSDALQGVRAVRRAPAVRRRSQHGQAFGGQGELGGGKCMFADAWRFRVRQRIRHRAKIPRNPPLSGRSDLHKHDLQFCGRARAGPPQEFLMLALEGIPAISLELAITAPSCTRQLATTRHECPRLSARAWATS